MSVDVRTVRGFRPSQYGMLDDDSEEAELIRLANVEVYARRVSAGLPIFEEPRPAAQTDKSGLAR